jgi:hypothetical protein
MVSIGYMPKIEILLATAADNRCFLAPFSVRKKESKAAEVLLVAAAELFPLGYASTATPKTARTSTAHNHQFESPIDER